MRRLFAILLILALPAALFSGCWTKENPPTVHVVHKGQLYEVEHYPGETTACDLRDAELIEATIIPFNFMPAKEGEVNVNAQSVQIWDKDDDSFILIIDGSQYEVKYQ